MRTIMSITFTLVLILTLVGCNQSSSSVEDITTEELKSMLSEDYQFVDIRTEEEYNAGHIKEFNYNIDYYQFKDDYDMLNDLDKEKPIVIICNSGNRSGQAKELLSELGFTEVYNVTGGIKAWKDTLTQ